MHAYQDPDSPQTLAEGLAEYFRSNPGLLRGAALAEEAREFFRCHDVAHVVYGCGTALADEAVVKLSSVFGTTGGFGVLRGYRLHESLQIYTRLPAAETLMTMLQSVVIVPRTILRCVRQKRRWPWSDHEAFLAVPLRDIRAEFGIRVAHEAHSESAAR